jgi:hypothetical protein
MSGFTCSFNIETLLPVSQISWEEGWFGSDLVSALGLERQIPQ